MIATHQALASILYTSSHLVERIQAVEHMDPVTILALLGRNRGRKGLATLYRWLPVGVSPGQSDKMPPYATNYDTDVSGLHIICIGLVYI